MHQFGGGTLCPLNRGGNFNLIQVASDLNKSETFANVDFKGRVATFRGVARCCLLVEQALAALKPNSVAEIGKCRRRMINPSGRIT